MDENNHHHYYFYDDAIWLRSSENSVTIKDNIRKTIHFNNYVETTDGKCRHRRQPTTMMTTTTTRITTKDKNDDVDIDDKMKYLPFYIHISPLSHLEENSWNKFCNLSDKLELQCKTEKQPIHRKICKLYINITLHNYLWFFITHSPSLSSSASLSDSHTIAIKSGTKWEKKMAAEEGERMEQVSVKHVSAFQCDGFTWKLHYLYLDICPLFFQSILFEN